jgi:hypothetical protein
MKSLMSFAAIVTLLSAVETAAAAKTGTPPPGPHGANGTRHPGSGTHQTTCKKKHCAKPYMKVIQP